MSTAPSRRYVSVAARSLRVIVGETLAVGGISLLLVCALLASLPGESSDSWLSRGKSLVVIGTTLRFGYSTIERQPVLLAVGNAMIRSLGMVGATAALLLLVGVPVGIWSVTRADSRAVGVVRWIIGLASSLPVLFWATVIFVLFAQQFEIILREDVSLVRAMTAAIVALTLGDRILADIVQRAELGTRDIVREPYMRTVRASALGYGRHVLQGLVPSIAEAVASRSMFLIGGAIVAEFVFDIHGLGYVIVNALKQRSPEPELVLAASLALVGVGLLFRVVLRSIAAAADLRTLG